MVDYEKLNSFVESCVRDKVEEKGLQMNDGQIRTITGLVSGAIKPMFEESVSTFIEALNGEGEGFGDSFGPDIGGSDDINDIDDDNITPFSSN